MKKILYSLIAAVSFAGCSGLLDTEPLDKYTESVVWNDATLAQLFIYNTYADVFTEFLYTPGITNSNQPGCGMEAFTDNMLADTWLQTDYKMNIASSGYDYGWDGKKKSIFSCIRQANVIIEEAAASSLPGTTKAGMIAQGKFLRAMIYFKQARIFGGFVVVDHVLSPTDDFAIPRSSIDETYDFIIKDLQEAVVDLPTNETCTYITKGAAYALMAEVALQAAAYSENGGKDKYLQISLDASEALFAINKYSLDNSYYNIFNNFGAHTSNSEIILAFAPVEADGFASTQGTSLQYRYVFNFKQSGLKEEIAAKYPIANDPNGVGGAFSPSQDILDAYQVVDEDGVAKKWNETSYYQNYKAGDPAADVLFKNRDARFDASFVLDGTSYMGNTLYFRVGGNAHPLSGQSTASAFVKNPVPCFQRKSINDYDWATGSGFGKNMDYHYVLLRLGRSYLNYAEALIRTGKGSEAIEWINKVRTTHGKLPALSASLSADELWDAYKLERRVEMYFEGEDRYWSLLRWYKHDGESNIPELNKDLTYYTEIGEDGIGFTENVPMSEKFFQNHVSKNKMVWDERRFLFPVPQSVIDESNGVITQNPGW